ncbi:hypothetical protein P691DRAFT_663990 [Macrolepiota fuliginosa MF-IS2]|uniref:Uncharacterized protein n=1 Tax=Macrolepiota fuliginosa MF-IS2 TaxID=1400762 RepID=A0A9P5XGM5_9AGAR|nr:hypothetical protein P691DRAFT_663990 [Macrolepiota fuliginosa MF-IS2]
MFGTRNVGLLQYVTSTTLPHIPEISGAPSPPPAGHKSHKNHLNVKSEAWRRLESTYQIDTFSFARQVVAWTMANIQDVPFKLEDPHTAEKLSLVTRRRDGLPHKIDHPVDTIDRLGAFLDILPLKSAQRLFHMLYPDTLDWKFMLNQAYDLDQNIFEYFLWTRTPPGDNRRSAALVVAYQPPWILSHADFAEFAKCSSLPPFIAPGHIYPSELQSKHRIWAKLWDTCVQHNTKWFILTSWNVWAFGGFSDGWCSGYISDIWHLDEHTPTVLECITFWIASAMECEDGYQRPKVGCVDLSSPRYINMPARLHDVLDQDLEAAVALAQMPL